MMSWSLQRAEHGEQPYWMAIALAAMLGQIGLPGGGFGFGYASVNGVGNAVHHVQLAVAAARPESGRRLHSGGAHRRHAARSARELTTSTASAGPIRTSGWSIGPAAIRSIITRTSTGCVEAWKRPETIIVHEFVVERAGAPCRYRAALRDGARAQRHRLLVARPHDRGIASRCRAADGSRARLRDLLRRWRAGSASSEAFTEGRDEEEWLRQLYNVARQRVAAHDLELPDFDTLWQDGVALLPEPRGCQTAAARFPRRPGDSTA